MKHASRPVRAVSKAAGVALVTAIFLLVVLAGLAVAVVSVVTTQQASSLQDVQGVRAYLAAKSGMEWALYRGLRVANGLELGKEYSFTLSDGGTLSSFTVTVTSTTAINGVVTNDANDATAGHYTITSTACNQPSNGRCPGTTRGPDYVQRVVNAQL